MSAYSQKRTFIRRGLQFILDSLVPSEPETVKLTTCVHVRALIFTYPQFVIWGGESHRLAI